jgi:hypothetical protein
VLVVDEARNEVVYRAELTVPAPDRPVVDFGAASVESFETTQDVDGDFTVGGGGDTLELSNNTWKRIDYGTTITTETVLTFEFRSTSEGQIHGIGLENDNGQTASRIFRLFGTQNWGEDDFETYSSGDGWVRYEIPVGDYYTGPARYLVFVNDDDRDVGSDSAFRNVRVYNESG